MERSCVIYWSLIWKCTSATFTSPHPKVWKWIFSPWPTRWTKQSQRNIGNPTLSIQIADSFPVFVLSISLFPLLRWGSSDSAIRNRQRNDGIDYFISRDKFPRKQSNVYQSLAFLAFRFLKKIRNSADNKIIMYLLFVCTNNNIL